MKLSTLIITCAVLFLAASAFLYGYIQNNRPSNIVGIDMPIELLELTQQNRLAAFPEPHPNLQKILEGFKTPNLDAETDIQIAERIQQYRRRGSARPNELTHEQLIYDTEFLFDILRYGYGAYQYFGGDDVFLPLRETTLGRIHRLNNPATAGAYVNSLLVPALESVIADNHFWIDRNRIGIGSQLYMNHDFVVHRTDNGFATELGGTIHLVAETTLDGQQVEGLLPTLTEDGQFAWAFGHVIYGSYAPFGIYMDVIFENAETGEKTAYTVRLVKVSNASGLTSRMYSLSRRNGIPILRNRHLQGNMQHSFTNTGATLRDEPVLILDLRGHNGGNDGLAWEWIRQYTGQAPGHGVMFSSVRRHSLIGNTLAYWMPYSSPPEWNILHDDTPLTIIPNENFIIVLTDNNIGSAGDSFVGYLRQLENVLIVGTNTRGVLVTGNLGNARLPHSGAVVHFGVSLNVRPDLSQFEGVGFAPDLWVPPDDSLNRVLRFIEKYGIVYNE